MSVREICSRFNERGSKGYRGDIVNQGAVNINEEF